MFEIFLIVLAMALGGGGGSDRMAKAPSNAVQPSGLIAEDQTPTGRFTTATEIRPILNATRGNWIAVREYDGADLLYLTHLLSWRCGLVLIEVGLNGDPVQPWPMEPCHSDTPTPNALLDGTPEIYKRYPLNSIERIDLRITYDDLTTDQAGFDRNGVMIP
ncbi:MAG: hypothetical protein N4A53_12430 [Pelagimonas sp.]|jgi:hypothetical protein|nr:hypothetical protein [Pelagimonas sp.]